MTDPKSISTFIGGAVRREPEPMISVGPNGWKVPARVAHLCYPAGRLISAHGVGTDFECLCGAGAPTHYTARCPVCSRPYPTRCESCDGWTDPIDAGRLGWYAPPAQCQPCAEDASRASRADALRGVPHQARAAALEYVSGVPQRAGADEALDGWISSGGGRGPGGRPIVWLSGGHRSGKTVAMTRAAVAVVEAGHVSGLLWTTTRRLFEHAKARWQRQDGDGSDLLADAKAAPLLVIDEFWGDAGGARRTRSPVISETHNALLSVADVLEERAEHRRPTLIGSLWPVSSVQSCLGASAWYRMERLTIAADLGDRKIAAG